LEFGPIINSYCMNSRFSQQSSMTMDRGMTYASPKEFRAPVVRDLPAESSKEFRLESQDGGSIYRYKYEKPFLTKSRMDNRNKLRHPIHK